MPEINPNSNINNNPNINKLSEAQKEQAKEHQKSHAYISNSWGLFLMYLGEHKNDPQLALDKTRTAMDLWMEFEAAAYVEPPDIPQFSYVPPEPFDIARAMREIAPIIAETMQKRKNDNTIEEMLASAEEQTREDEEHHNPPLGELGELGSPRTNPKEGG